MWAQRLGHKNTSRVKTTWEELHSKSHHRPFSSSPSPPGSSWGKRDASMLKYFRSVSFSLLFFSLNAIFKSCFSWTKAARHRGGGRNPTERQDSVWLEGSLKDTSWVLEHGFRKGGHGRDYWATAPSNSAHLPYDIMSLPSCVSPPGYPFWPRKPPDPALRVC